MMKITIMSYPETNVWILCKHTHLYTSLHMCVHNINGKRKSGGVGGLVKKTMG